jgi:ankyrin repeat protein
VHGCSPPTTTTITIAATITTPPAHHLSPPRSDLRTTLHIAAAEGHYPICEYLVLQGGLVNSEDRFGNTPLVDAMANDQKEVCELLQRHGAKKLDRTAHIAAMCQAAGAGDLKTVKRLMSSGVDVNSSDYDFRTPLHIAASMGQLNVAQHLVKSGARADVCDRWQNTPIDDSARGGFDDLTALLQESGTAKRRASQPSRHSAVPPLGGGQRQHILRAAV